MFNALGSIGALKDGDATFSQKETIFHRADGPICFYTGVFGGGDLR